MIKLSIEDRNIYSKRFLLAGILASESTYAEQEGGKSLILTNPTFSIAESSEISVHDLRVGSDCLILDFLSAAW